MLSKNKIQYYRDTCMLMLTAAQMLTYVICQVVQQQMNEQRKYGIKI